MQRTIVFDNTDRAHSGALLAPLTDLRPVFDVRTGALTTLERMTRRAVQNDLPRPDGVIVPERLSGLTRERHTALKVNDAGSRGPTVLLVNGACPLLDTDTTGVELGEALVDQTTGAVLKANVQARDVDRVLSGDVSGLKTRASAGGGGAGVSSPGAVLTRPWHVRTHRDACIAADLGLIVASRGDWLRPTQQVFASPGAVIHPTAVFDTERGPVVIEEHAVVRPLAVLVGPVYVGPNSTVLEHALIKAQTAIGPHCKVGGEVGGTIIQGFSNKAHDGHLGDSWLGEWVNLGAGTTNSNLLNTYGEVIAKALRGDVEVSRCQGVEGTAATPSCSNERTGETFFGCVLGDHVKTAISTRIMTGAIVGTGTMWAATAPMSGAVGPYSWVTDGESVSKPSVRGYRFEKFLEVARAAMGRRKTTPSEAYVGVLRGVGERLLARE